MCDNPTPLVTKTTDQAVEPTTTPKTGIHQTVTQSPQSSRPSGARLRHVVLWGAIVGFLVLGVFEAWSNSATFDEPVYVSSGVISILHHDVADNAEHPPLFKALAALPVLAVGPVVPGDGHWNANNERSYSTRF